MPSLLVRDMDPQIERELKKRAKESGQSLSSMAQTLMRRGLAADQPRGGLGTELRGLAASHGWFDIDIERDTSERSAPDFL